MDKARADLSIGSPKRYELSGCRWIGEAPVSVLKGIDSDLRKLSGLNLLLPEYAETSHPSWIDLCAQAFRAASRRQAFAADYQRRSEEASRTARVPNYEGGPRTLNAMGELNLHNLYEKRDAKERVRGLHREDARIDRALAQGNAARAIMASRIEAGLSVGPEMPMGQLTQRGGSTWELKIRRKMDNASIYALAARRSFEALAGVPFHQLAAESRRGKVSEPLARSISFSLHTGEIELDRIDGWFRALIAEPNWNAQAGHEFREYEWLINSIATGITQADLTDPHIERARRQSVDWSSFEISQPVPNSDATSHDVAHMFEFGTRAMSNAKMPTGIGAFDDPIRKVEAMLAQDAAGFLRALSSATASSVSPTAVGRWHSCVAEKRGSFSGMSSEQRFGLLKTFTDVLREQGFITYVAEARQRAEAQDSGLQL